MDRITRLLIRNVRAIEEVDLDLQRPLTVLIGENGAGKSTIIECLELLRKAADPSFFQQLYAVHRGLSGLLRKGATSLDLGVIIEDDDAEVPRLTYVFKLAAQGAGAVVLKESLLLGSERDSRTVLVREAAGGEMLDERLGKRVAVPPEAMRPDQLVAASFGSIPPHKSIERLLAVLRGIEVHLGFDTLAAWASRSYQRPVIVRGAITHFPAPRLDLLGVNLANAWSELRGREASHWERTLEIVRLGLGERVDSVLVKPDPGGGNIYLALRFFDVAEPVLASDLSDGQLAWLAFVAMARLNTERSFLAIDEPELHLHPSLLGGVVTLLKSIGAPVVLSTHADRVLELLDEPADAVRVCSLEGGKAVVSRVDAGELPRWLAKFGDFARLRASGYLPRVLKPTPVANQASP